MKYDLVYGKENINDDPKVYQQTLREIMEELAKEEPGMSARNALHWFYGFLGTKGAPCIDAGIFLRHFLQAVDDGLFEWEARK